MSIKVIAGTSPSSPSSPAASNLPTTKASPQPQPTPICDLFCPSQEEVFTQDPWQDPWLELTTPELTTPELTTPELTTPELTTSTPSPENVSTITAIHLYLPGIGDTSSSHIHYGILKDELYRLGGRYNFKVIPTDDGSFIWTEDPRIRLADGGSIIPDENAQQNFLQAQQSFRYPPEDAPNIHDLGAAINWTHTIPDSKNNRIVPFFIDGGNILTTRNREGEIVSIIGKGSLYVNTVLLDSNGELDPKAVQTLIDEKQWSSEEIELTESILLSNDGHSPLYSSANGDDLNKKALEFLAKQELTKEIIADSLGIPSDRVHFVSQAAFHIDMETRVGRDGEIFIADENKSIELLENLLNDPNTPAEDIPTLQRILNNHQGTKTPIAAELSNRHNEALDRQAQELTDLGFTVHRAPASFNAFNNPIARYMNGEMGEDPHSGETYYIVSSSGVGSLDGAFAKHMKEKHDITVDFLTGTTDSLRQGGGFDCLTGTIREIRATRE